jgi:hypothetical protein
MDPIFRANFELPLTPEEGKSQPWAKQQHHLNTTTTFTSTITLSRNGALLSIFFSKKTLMIYKGDKRQHGEKRSSNSCGATEKETQKILL